MESRKEALRALTACRFCLRRGSLTSIYDKSRNKTLVPLPLQIMACVNIEVFPSDGMPSQICERCEFFIIQGYQFKQVCRAADETLLQFVQSGGPLAPVEWPAELLVTDATRIAVSGGKGGRKADAGGGESGVGQLNVQLCAGSDAESDDEDVLNIKIETEGDDGEEEAASGSPARIKVTQRGGKLHITEEGDQDPDEDAETAAVKAQASDLATGKFACDSCNRVFPLQQLLQLHKKRHHRERNVPCPICPDKFFSKYDLQTHMSTHSDEMPFQCVACGQRFKRYSLLKKHEKNRHADSAKFQCSNCTDSFLSQEELKAHMLRHRDYDNRPYTCPVKDPPCSSRFQNKATLTRHMELVHTKSNRFSCNYCDQKFSTQVRLARHVKEHAGSRPYPCRFCSKTFIKSHHYTRHLRMNHGHGQLGTSVHSSVTESALYQCSDCGESFNSQELLAYHEAQHTAQNLTCPLCQEHFPDVDAVTEHIKLHADQEKQFVCDFCELVFVTEPKLEQHMCDEHSEEMYAQENEMEEGFKEDCNTSSEMDTTTQQLPGLNDEEEEEVEVKPAAVVGVPDEGVQTEGEEATYTELATVDTLHIARMKNSVPVPDPATTAVTSKVEKSSPQKSPTAGILRKAEEVKRRAEQERSVPEHSPNKMSRPAKLTPVSPATLVKKTVVEKKLLSPERKVNEVAAVTTQKIASLEKQKEREKESPKEIKEVDKKQERDDKKIEKEEKRTIREDKKSEREERRPDKEYKKSDREDKKSEREVKKSEREEKKSEREEKKIDREEKKPDKEEKKTEREETPSEKSLRILERDLQELKRTSGNGSGRTPDSADKPVSRGRGRPPLTPAQRIERMRDKGRSSTPRGGVRRSAVSSRDRKPKEEERDPPSDKPARPVKIEKDNKDSEDAPMRRSSRASRVKDYAKMIRDSDDSESENGPDECETSDEETTPPPPVHTDGQTPGQKRRGRPPKNSTTNPLLTSPASSAPLTFSTPTTTASSAGSVPKRRGRPSGSSVAVVSKKMRSDSEEKKDSPATPTSTPSPTPVPPGTVVQSTAGNVVLTSSGQTLTKVPVKSLPPGVKPRLLPTQLQQSVANAPRGSICEMKMGEKTVKVQKIVMTKAEVEDMYKKGLLEMKHGTMVLKAPKLAGGAKLPMGDPNAIRSFVRAAAAATPVAVPAPAANSEHADTTSQPEAAGASTTAEQDPETTEST